MRDRSKISDKDVDSFIADALDFCGDGIYPRFLHYMAELDYSEAEVEALTAVANKRAGRV